MLDERIVIARDFYEDLKAWTSETMAVDKWGYEYRVYDFMMEWSLRVREAYKIKHAYRLYDFCKWFFNFLTPSINDFLNMNYYEFLEDCGKGGMVLMAVDFYCFDVENYRDYNGDFYAYWKADLEKMIKGVF